MRTVAAARLWAAATGLVGVGMVAQPAAMGRWAAGPDRPPATAVVRTLGIREVLQGLVIAARPTRTAVAIGAAVDLTHAVTMAAAGALLPHYRRPALASGVFAVGSALAGLLSLPNRPR